MLGEHRVVRRQFELKRGMPSRYQVVVDFAPGRTDMTLCTSSRANRDVLRINKAQRGGVAG